MARILVCYRIADAEPLAHRLIEHLQRVFASEKVVDIQDGQGFLDFKRGDVLLPLLGSSWVNSGQQPSVYSSATDDPARTRIASALLNHAIFVIPVLLHDTPAPQFADLPMDLQPMVLRQMFPCRDDQFENDTIRIVHAIRARIATRVKSRWLVLATSVALLILLFGAVFLLLRSETVQGILSDFQANLERIDPSRADSYRQQGWASYEADNYQQAIEYFQKAIRLRVNDSDAYDGLGWSYYKLNRLAEAEASFNHLVELAPLMTSSYMERGRFYRAVGNAKAAIPDLEKVVEKSPTNEEAFMGLAQSYQDVGNYQKAIDTYQQVVTQINRRNASAYYGLGESNDALKRPKQALDSYQRYLELETKPDPAVVKRVQELEQQTKP